MCTAAVKIIPLLIFCDRSSNLIGTKYIKPFITADASGMTDGEAARKAQEYVEYITRGQLEALGAYE